MLFVTSAAGAIICEEGQGGSSDSFCGTKIRCSFIFRCTNCSSSCSKEEAPESQKQKHSVQAGLGEKGNGDDNFGMAIPGASAIPPQMQPAAAGGGVEPSSYYSADIAFTVPEPIQATSEEVQERLKTFTLFKTANNMPQRLGQ